MLGDNQFADVQGRRPQGRASDAEAAPEQGWGARGDDQPLVDLASYWRLALKYRFLIIGCFLGALVIGATSTLLMTPVYRSTVTLMIDRLESSCRPGRSSEEEGREFAGLSFLGVRGLSPE